MGCLCAGAELGSLPIAVAKQSIETVSQLLFESRQGRGVGGSDRFLQLLEKRNRILRGQQVGCRLERQGKKDFGKDCRAATGRILQIGAEWLQLEGQAERLRLINLVLPRRGVFVRSENQGRDVDRHLDLSDASRERARKSGSGKGVDSLLRRDVGLNDVPLGRQIQNRICCGCCRDRQDRRFGRKVEKAAGV